MFVTGHVAEAAAFAASCGRPGNRGVGADAWRRRRMVPARCFVVGSWSERVARAEAAEVDEAALAAAGTEGTSGLDLGGRRPGLRVRRRLRGRVGAALAREEQARLPDERASGRVPEH